MTFRHPFAIVPTLLALSLAGITAAAAPAVAEPAAAASAVAADLTPDFTGLWKLDTETSDDPMEVMRAARERRGSGGRGGAAGRGGGGGFGGRGGGGGFGGGGGGFGGGGRGGGLGGGGGFGGGRAGGPGGDSQLDPATLRERFEAQQEALSTLVVSFEGDLLLIEDAAGTEQRIPTTGEKFERLDFRGEPIESTAKFKGSGRLVIKTTRSEDRKVTETWELVGDAGMRLLVTTETEGGRMGRITLRRFYDLVEITAAVANWAPPTTTDEI